MMKYTMAELAQKIDRRASVDDILAELKNRYYITRRDRKAETIDISPSEAAKLAHYVRASIDMRDRTEAARLLAKQNQKTEREYLKQRHQQESQAASARRPTPMNSACMSESYQNPYHPNFVTARAAWRVYRAGIPRKR